MTGTAKGSMTPGPWHFIGVDKEGSGYAIVVADDPGRKGTLALVDGWEKEDGDCEREANARAIAALPELIEAARIIANAPLIAARPDLKEAFVNLRRILARIEGGA